MSDKHGPVNLPETLEEAIGMALLREQMAQEARDQDKHGTAREFELTALLLREYAQDLTEGPKMGQFWWRDQKKVHCHFVYPRSPTTGNSDEP